MDDLDLRLLRKLFGEHVPDRIAKLFEYADEEGPGIVCDFMVMPSLRPKVDTWFDEDEETSSRIIPVGIDGTSSIYGFWTYDGRSVELAPVVFLDAERAYNRVLASTFDEFLALLATGQRQIGRDDRWLDAPAPCRDLAAFRAFVREAFGVAPAPDPRALVSSARAAHPDFAAWVSAWRARRGAPRVQEDTAELDAVVAGLAPKV